ncbi:carbohydrate ABC transporter permease [Clostridium tagluense]|uniref:carbohydrate ABC transporter permease n=1 Tax=Clostridium tagluense TaxID=360422 RepID=UPI001CF18268|nr:carbohydrate ABC transporter permease [Clostridium tagluense]MCB2313807.1 carbohydrate ABC transporter permease [Clostridium tagluense]MCB2318643.1 carbohydrate ABC transporter permease [Clostridium tagluense]MCB2323518.1 carbohydrate ABC transporter permease [Clostridium tagluense]MCB2328387.1 carbohydrate ABC transporter permease [Clostridium tagluense]MCB2333221.1 carbohydrate ABC transporter permease [Clostridium tagluense]
MIKKTKKLTAGNLTLGVVGVALGILFLSPFYIIIINSFKTKKELFGSVLSFPKIFTFNNYKEAFDRLHYVSAITNSLIITISGVILIAIFASMAGWMLERTKSKLSNAILLLFVASMLIPFQAIMLPLIRIMGNLKLLNMGGLIFMYLGFGAALSIFLYHGFVKGIPKELDEASMLDGCNKFQTFWYIIFPLLKPITVTVSILNTVWLWNDFLLPSLVINTPETQTLPLRTFFFFGEYTKQWHLALAGLTLAIIPVVIFYFLAQKQIIKSIAAGSIK